jgi:hypothetical protein
MLYRYLYSQGRGHSASCSWLAIASQSEVSLCAVRKRQDRLTAADPSLHVRKLHLAAIARRDVTLRIVALSQIGAN